LELTGDLFVDACLIWTGYGETSYPRRDESVFQARLGNETCERLLPRIKSLNQDFETSRAYEPGIDFVQCVALAACEFKARHPEVDERIVTAFTWCYIHDWK
jgi:hypothetical protein